MNSFKCPQCGLTNWATAETCKRCSLVFQAAAAETYDAPGSFGDAAHHNFNQSPPFNFQPSNEWSPNNQYDSRYQSPNYQYHQNANLKSGLAIASMGLGILGFLTAFLLIGLLFAPVGLVLGIVALVKIKKKPHIYGGQGFAIAGVITSSMVVLVLPIIAAIAIPNLLAARRAANEGSALATLRTIADAEQTYMEAGGRTCGELKELAARNLVNPTIAQGEKSGYRFSVVMLPLVDGGCELHATPLVSTGIGSTGIRSFYFSTEDGLLRGADKKGKMADKNDALIK